MEIKKQTNLRGELTVPGDKSISHRAVMFGSLAQGTTKITHFLEGADCLSTISVSGKWESILKEMLPKSSFMERDFTDSVLRLKLWMWETAGLPQD